MKNYYITTTLPYVNAKPHIGFALEIVQADAIARYQRLLGKEVFYNTGTDEHGLKVYRKAKEIGMDPKKHADECADKFRGLEFVLDLDKPKFIRTTDGTHKRAAQKFWNLCLKNGDIYKKNYKVKYCVGCELEKTDSELEDGKCCIHPNLKIEFIDEENYFFKFSKYQKELLDYYESNHEFVVPEYRFNEIKKFVQAGLQDFSISRLKEKMPWGVPVPNDKDHVMYVWFDALINYVSTLGWPENAENFEKFWGTKEKPNAVQVAGKDNLRQQSAMWQAMLLSAGLPNSKQIFIHGFIGSGGQKMSKSLGNVIDPYQIAEEYGTDALRYYLLGAIPAYDDGDFTIEKFEKYYTAHLVNGIGNLVSRILSMVEKYNNNKVPPKAEDTRGMEKFWRDYDFALSKYKFDEAVRLARDLTAFCDEKISIERPWEKAKKGHNISPLLYQITEYLRHIGLSLFPIVPKTAKNILQKLGIDADKLSELEYEKKWGGLKEGAIIKKGETLFPRLDK